MDDKIKEAEEFGAIKASFDIFISQFKQFTDTVERKFEKTDKLIENMQLNAQAKPVTLNGILASLATLFVIIGALFTAVIMTINYSNGPIRTQTEQIVKSLTIMQAQQQQNSLGVQLLNKEVAQTVNKTASNTDTIQWMLFDENIPKQVTINSKDIDTLKDAVSELKQQRSK